MVRLTLPLVPLVTVLLAGCTPDLAGTWSSDTSCFEEDLESAENWADTREFGFFLSAVDSDTYEGTGEHSFDLRESGNDDDEGVYWEYEFDLELELGRWENAETRELDGRLDNCVEIDLGEIDCPPPFDGVLWPNPGQAPAMLVGITLLDELGCNFLLY